MWSRHHHLAQHLRQVLPCEARVFRLAHTSASRKQNERLQTSSSSLSKGLSIQHERHEHQGMSQRCQRSEHYQTTKHILSIEGSCQLSSCAQPAELCQPSVFIKCTGISNTSKEVQRHSTIVYTLVLSPLHRLACANKNKPLGQQVGFMQTQRQTHRKCKMSEW